MQRTALVLLLASSLAACGGSSDVAPHDGGGTDGGGTDGGGTDGGGMDGGGMDGGGMDGGGTDGGGTDGGGGGCGTLRPDVSAVSGTEGLVIARDGTIYFSQPASTPGGDGYVGRLLPDGSSDRALVRLPAASTVWGIALDDANTHLYVGSPSTHHLHAVDLTTTPPTVTTLVAAAGQPNGVTMGPDGAVYFTDFGAGTVQRADPAGAGGSTTVTTSTIPNANGLIFAPGDPTTLYVLSYGNGRLYRLTLDAAHLESARATVAMGLGSPDGVMLDAAGHIYVTDNSGGGVYRLNNDGTMKMTVLPGLNAPANLEFGTGPLACHDLYVATGDGITRIDTMTATSAALSWH